MDELAHRAWDGLGRDQLPRYRQLRTDRFLEVAASVFPDKPAVIFGDASLTYAELDARTNRVANGLLALGAVPGDVIGVIAGNDLDVFPLLYGIARAGMAELPMNPRYTATEIGFQIEEAGATLTVAPGRTELRDVLDRGHDGPPDVVVGEDDFFQVRFTSGTTGRPKAIATTQRAIGYMHQVTARELEYSSSDVALVTAPVAHAAFHLAAATVAVGGTIVVESAFNPETIWAVCDRYGVTHTFMAPTMVAMALDKPGSGQSLRGLFVTASTFPAAVKKRFRARFPQVKIYESYGATELGFATLLRPDAPSEKDATVGLPAFGYELKILDPEGTRAAPGEIGEIYVRGPSMSFGYVGSIEMKPNQARDGWVSAGDLGSVDADGYLTVADRRDDLIVSGGLNVYPAEVEDVLLRTPGVVEVAVVGVPHEVWGHVVVAGISGDATDADLEAACRSELAGYKVPRHFLRLDELPKNPSGKILRRVVRDEAAVAFGSKETS